jgi:hypothetical protein
LRGALLMSLTSSSKTRLLVIVRRAANMNAVP